MREGDEGSIMKGQQNSNNILIVQHFYLVGYLLFLTGVVKLLSSFGDAAILKETDPILTLRYHQLYIVLGVVEIGIGTCMISKWTHGIKSTIIFGLSAEFILYRALLWFFDIKQTCPCLGRATAWLGIDETDADIVLVTILVYMILGTGVVEAWLLAKRKSCANGNYFRYGL